MALECCSLLTDAGTVGAVASGTDGLDGTGGFIGPATPSPSGKADLLSASRSHGSALPPVSHRAASPHSLPLVVPTRGRLRIIEINDDRRYLHGKRLQTAWTLQDCFLGTPPSCATTGNHRRLQSIDNFSATQLSSSRLSLSRHCTRSQRCHADAIKAKFIELYPGAYDRDRPIERVPTSEELNLLASLREEPPSEDGSAADEGDQSKGSGWTGSGPPMRVGVGYTARDMCDGQALPSPGRWSVASRRYPATPIWKTVTWKFKQFSEQHGTQELLMNLALGRVKENQFTENAAASSGRPRSRIGTALTRSPCGTFCQDAAHPRTLADRREKGG